MRSAWTLGAVGLLATGCLMDRSGRGRLDGGVQPDVRVIECVADTDCDDALFCNGFELCADGTCVPGAPPSCEDAHVCTVDVCDEAEDGCVRVPDHGLCDDDEQCAPSAGCTPVAPCEDDAGCDDGFVCNGSERCAGDRCVPGLAPDCGDAHDCTIDVCSEGRGGCAQIPDDRACGVDEVCDPSAGCEPAIFCTLDANCDDGNFCDGPERCAAGRCASGARPDCADVAACSVDLCDEAMDRCRNVPDDRLCAGALTCVLPGGCVFVGVCDDNGDCDDGFHCNGAETCDAGTCQAGLAPSCGDGVDCTFDLCDEVLDRCANLPDDGACGVNETCDATLDCVPECTTPADCDDGAFCSGVETCVAGACVAGTPPACADAVPCTTDLCDETANVCRNVIDDGACGVNETCHATLGCVPECRTPADCDDGAFCSGAETCVAGACMAGTPPSCGDALRCTIDLCDETANQCRNVIDDGACGVNETCHATLGCVPECTAPADCDDGAFCSGAETCVAGACVAGTPPACDDGVDCTVDLCDEGGDRCLAAPDDGRCPGPTDVCGALGCVALGAGPENPGATCAALLAAGRTVDGAYWVDPDGAGGVGVRRVFCDMTSDGGGWTLVLETDASTAAHYTAVEVSPALLTTRAIDGVAKHADEVIRALMSAGTGELRVEVATQPPSLFARGFTWSVPEPASYPAVIEATTTLATDYGPGGQCYDGDAPCGVDHWCLGLDVFPTAPLVCIRRFATGGLWLENAPYVANYYPGLVWVR